MAAPRQRKRRGRAPDPGPVQQEHSPGLRASPAPRLVRATAEPSARGYVSSRPGDHWRERLRLPWREAGTCWACRQPRYLLVGLDGEAAVCDLRHEIDSLRALGACTCSYATLEGVS